MSAGIHLVLILGSAIVVVDHLVCVGDGASGIACSFREDGGRYPSIERVPDVFRTEALRPEASSSPAAFLTEEMASAFSVSRQNSGCPVCKAERRTAGAVPLRRPGPQGRCCRHAMMVEPLCGVDLIER